MNDSKPSSFRMSSKAHQLLTKLARENGIRKTEVLEYCVARYAAELGLDVEGAKSLLLGHLANTIGKTSAKRR